MTKLDPTQAGLLAQITAAKAEYDGWLAKLETELDVLKSQHKDPLRKLVARAIETGVPIRQIHLNGLGYKHVASMTTFLDGGAKLSADDILRGLRAEPGQAPALEGLLTPPSMLEMTVRPEPGMVRWTRADGTEMSIERRDTMYFYYIPQAYVDKLTPEEYEWFKNDAKTLMGKAEYEEWQRTADEPERWATQRDNPHIRRV